MSSRLNFLTMTGSAELKIRNEKICQDFGYSHLSIPNADALKDLSFEQVQFMVTDSLSSILDVRKKYRDSFILALVSEADSQEQIVKVKNSGANHVLRIPDAFKKSYLEFIASQVIRAAFVPVKISEFSTNAVLEFSLYHLMPLNQKLLPILPKGSPLDEARLKKLEGIGEVFVRRDEIDRYRMYVETHPDSSQNGLKSRCRVQYLSLANAHSQLMFLITDAENTNTDKEAKWLSDRCDILSNQLLMTLSKVGEAWDVVNNSSIGEMGSVERAPTIGAYASLISFLTSVGDPRDVMMASLLSDVGMLQLHPEISKKLRESSDLAKLSSDERREYELHPSESLHLCEQKKIQLSDKVKNIILCSHEQISGKGFPNHKKDKIPEEAMLLQFCELIDREALVRMGHQRRSVQEVRMKILTELFKDGQILSIEFLRKLSPVIN